MSAPDESWPMIEEAVFRLFDELAGKNPGEHVAVGPPLQELGWSDIEAEYPGDARRLLFRAQGKSLAHTNILDEVVLAELTTVLDETVDGVVLPRPLDGAEPGSTAGCCVGMVLGPLGTDPGRRLAVPARDPRGMVTLGVIDADALVGRRMDTFDASSHWTSVHGNLSESGVEASTEWAQAVAAAHRVLSTELIAVADEVMRVAVKHVSVRHQFGVPIGSFQSPRHSLADAKASLEGARALLSEAWHDGGRLSAHAAKIAAGRAHRAAADAAMQVCGAIGLTAEHELHRYVARGFQIDSTFGSYAQLERSLATDLFETSPPGDALPAVVGQHG